MTRDKIVAEIQQILKDKDIKIEKSEVEEAVEEVYGKTHKELGDAKSRTIKCVLFGIISIMLCAELRNSLWVYIVCLIIIVISVSASVIDIIKINKMNDTMAEKLADNIFNKYCNKRIN